MVTVQPRPRGSRRAGISASAQPGPQAARRVAGDGDNLKHPTQPGGSPEGPGRAPSPSRLRRGGHGRRPSCRYQARSPGLQWETRTVRDSDCADSITGPGPGDPPARAARSAWAGSRACLADWREAVLPGTESLSHDPTPPYSLSPSPMIQTLSIH